MNVIEFMHIINVCIYIIMLRSIILLLIKGLYVSKNVSL